jgi:hypothetical protein
VLHVGVIGVIQHALGMLGRFFPQVQLHGVSRERDLGISLVPADKRDDIVLVRLILCYAL